MRYSAADCRKSGAGISPRAPPSTSFSFSTRVLRDLAECNIAAIFLRPPSFVAPAYLAMPTSPGDRAVSDSIAEIASLPVIPEILRSVMKMTGMGYAVVSRVTASSWIACAVVDELDFGVGPGSQLPLEQTLCKDVCEQRQRIAFAQASSDPRFRTHPVPQHYGIESYAAIPIVRSSGELFGTLCVLDREARPIDNEKLLNTLELFATLIGNQLDLQDRLAESESARNELNLHLDETTGQSQALRSELQRTRSEHARLSGELGVRETALLDELAAGRLRDQFIAVLGHDLRSPLQTIAMCAHMLGRLELPTAAQQLVGNLGRASDRMRELVENVLDFARGQLGAGIPVSLRAVPGLDLQMRQWVDAVATANKRVIDARIDLQGPVTCDPDRLAQVLVNLLTNAITHGAAERPVRIEAFREYGSIVIAVENHGAPIPPDRQIGLFRPFSRASSDPTSSGLGLGLYISSEIVRAHGGSIAVSSTPARTRFWVTLPQS